ncbi:MAG: DUF4404 family protein [Planctomycetes bacterium]|nr:DUF4404 family protein [Planctomycetota bacterium]
MPIRSLRQTLAELHDQLEAASSIDGDDRDALKQAMRDIAHSLDKNASPSATTAEARATSSEGGALDRLESLVEDFEADHPLLSKQLAALAASLRNIGF